MILAEAPALSSALELRRAPRAARPSRFEALPRGILLLIRVVAGDEQAIAEAREACTESAEVIREASAFYLQQVLFAADANSYRVLGVNPDEDDARIRDHYRLLARWLHPDRNPDAWEVVYAERVSSAWQNLRTPERRERYDRALAETEFGTPQPHDAMRTAAGIVRPQAALADDYPLPSERLNLRWVPSAIFVGLGVSALAVVFLYVVRMREPPEGAGPENQIAAESKPIDPALQKVLAAPVQLAPTKANAPVAPTAEVAATEATTKVAEPAPVATVPVAANPVAIQESPPSVAPAAPRSVVTRAPPPAAIAAVPPPPKPIAKPEPKLTARHTAGPAPARSTPQPVAVAAAAVVADSSPAPEQAAESPAAAQPDRIRQADANRLLGHFSQAFEQGDIDQMRELFAADARGPDGSLREILASYDKVFDSSSERSLMVHDVNWFENGDTVTIVAGYDASVTSRGGKARRTKGDIRLDLRRENDRWRIYRLRHDERPG